jgi:hypothetical protein
LTLSEEHLLIQSKKKRENWINVGIEASRLTRKKRGNESVSQFVNNLLTKINDPLLLVGSIAYEAEGAKGSKCEFCNTDFRIIKVFLAFAKKYLIDDQKNLLNYRLYIHDSRKEDLKRILSYWATKLSIDINEIRISWKHNEVKKIRKNKDYNGLISVHISKGKYLSRKILAISDIIMKPYCGVG